MGAAGGRGVVLQKKRTNQGDCSGKSALRLDAEAANPKSFLLFLRGGGGGIVKGAGGFLVTG